MVESSYSPRGTQISESTRSPNDLLHRNPLAPELRFLRIIIGLLMVGALVAMVALRLTVPDQTLRLAGPALIFAVAILSFVALAINRVTLATYVLSLGVWTSLVIVTAFTQGVRSPVVLGFPLLIMSIGWLQSIRMALIITALTIAATLLMVLAQLQGWQNFALESPLAVHAGDQIVVYLLSAALVTFFVTIYQARLGDLQQVGRNLMDKNQALEARTHALKQAKLALKTSEDRYRTLIEWTPDAILVHRLGKIIYVNSAAVRLFGAPYAQALMAKSTTELIHPDDRAMQAQRMQSLYKHEPVQSAVECKFLRLDGQVVDVEVHGIAIDFDGEPAIQVAIHNISRRKHMENQVRQMAFYDALTQLPNRRLLHDRLNQAIATHKRSAHFGAVMFLDLDNFKPLNDQFGHSVGDLLLVEVALRLKACVREVDTIARFGGDEFVVVIEELTGTLEESKGLMHNLAKNIGASLSEPYHLAIIQPDGNAVSVQHTCTASIGVAMLETPNASADDLVKWADAAMYQAKQSGRNHVCFSSPESQSHSELSQPAKPT